MKPRSRASGFLPSQKVNMLTLPEENWCAQACQAPLEQFFFPFLRFSSALPVSALLPVQQLSSESSTEHFAE